MAACGSHADPYGATSDGVSEGIRTPDPQDHNLVLCRLSYAHHDRALQARPDAV
jgi:hypothetical protein